MDCRVQTLGCTFIILRYNKTKRTCMKYYYVHRPWEVHIKHVLLAIKSLLGK